MLVYILCLIVNVICLWHNLDRIFSQREFPRMSQFLIRENYYSEHILCSCCHYAIHTNTISNVQFQIRVSENNWYRLALQSWSPRQNRPRQRAASRDLPARWRCVIWCVLLDKLWQISSHTLAEGRAMSIRRRQYWSHRCSIHPNGRQKPQTGDRHLQVGVRQSQGAQPLVMLGGSLVRDVRRVPSSALVR